MILTALFAMMFASVAHHLGLLPEMAKIALKIANCPKCSSFWVTLLVFTFRNCDICIAIGLSLLMAYLSYWFGLILILFNKIYSRIWQRLEQKKKKIEVERKPITIPYKPIPRFAGGCKNC